MTSPADQQLLPGESEYSSSTSDRRALLAAALLGLMTALPHAADFWRGRGNAPSWTWDIDTSLIHAGLERAPSLADTLSWWTGPWVGQVPFYRPLSSYLFWIEWKIFGVHEWLYAFPGLIGHILATTLFAALGLALGRGRGLRRPEVAAVVAAWGFSGWLMQSRAAVVDSVIGAWKNQPDTFAAVFSFCALLCYIGAQRRGRTIPILAAICYLAACGFKEIAVPLPAVCLVLEMGRLRHDRGAASRLGWMIGAAIAFLCIRALALQGMGYTYGSNDQWIGRTLQELAGPFAATLIAGEWLGNAAGIWCFAVILFFARRLRSQESILNPDLAARTRARTRVVVAGLFAAFAGMGVLGTCYMISRESFDHSQIAASWSGLAGLMACLQPPIATEVMATTSLLLAGAVLVRRHPWVLGLSFTWMAAFLAPLTLSPGPSHRYYLPQAGYYILFAFASSVAIEWSRSVNIARGRTETSGVA